MLKNDKQKYYNLVKICGGLIILSLCAVFIYFSSEAQEKKPEPYQLFYTANHSYESKDYLKAMENYIAILDQGIESGNLYYNIGNSFLKLGRLGHAILCYEKARRLIPHDSDLRANLAYARSLAESVNDGSSENILMKVVGAIFGSYNLREIILAATVLYLILIILVGIFVANPFASRRLKIPIFLVAILFLISLLGSLVRYFDDHILRHGIVIQKDIACKYEPIDKSTTYYILREGSDVRILSTRNAWRQIARPDGKTGWVKRDAVEEI